MQNDTRDRQKEEEGRNEYIPGTQEKATLGGAFNSGVTSDDPTEKNEIEKKGSLANVKPKNTSQDSAETEKS